MGKKAKTRTEMVALLVEHALAMAAGNDQSGWLRTIFEKGFAGYNKLSSQQLALEMQLHGLDEVEETYEEPDDDDLEFQISRGSDLCSFSRAEPC